MINNKEELIKELKANDGRILLDHSALVINNITIHNDDYSIRMIHMDLDMIGTDDDIIEFCDMNGFVLLSMFLRDIDEFEVAWEYDEDRYIKSLGEKYDNN